MKHSAMLEPPWYWFDVIPPNSPAEYRCGIGLPSVSRISDFQSTLFLLSDQAVKLNPLKMLLLL